MKSDKQRVLVIDDDTRTLRMIKRILELEHYDVSLASNGASALNLLPHVQPDLVILDIMMPGMDGREVCRRIREFSDVPIIMVTARDDDGEVVQGLDTGADDYVTKPFSARELTARVRAVLRRSKAKPPAQDAVFRLDDLTIDLPARRVSVKEQELKLTSTEYRLLAYLTRNAGRVVTPDQLLDNVWGEEYMGAPHLLQVNIARLRRKMGDNARTPKYIITRPGIGYIMSKPS